MKMNIVQAGTPVLRTVARALDARQIASQDIASLIEAMRETMHAAPGVGLAAPQVGLSLQLAVIEDREEYQREVAASQLVERERRPVPFHVIINPRITERSGGPLEFFEGCLSLSGYTAVVPRARAVRVECLNQKGEQQVIQASGWYARILQHEIDHLLGTLYIDRMLPRTFSSLENWTEHWKGKPMEEIRGALQLDAAHHLLQS
jgi:peptide deformylase